MTQPIIRTIIAPNPSPMTLDGTRTYIVGRTRPAVIDPGPAIAAHVEAVLTALGRSVPVAIVVTHAHEDHSGAVADLAQSTGAPVVMADPGRIATSAPNAVHLRCEAGDTVELDTGTIRVLPTPGHTPDHIALLWSGRDAPEGGAAFVGDLMMGQGDTTLVAPPEGDLARYLRSLDVLQQSGAGILYPAHGPPLENPDLAIARFRQHRVMRVEQVRRILATQPDIRLSALVDLVFGTELDPRLRAAAEGSLRAVVQYLQRPD